MRPPWLEECCFFVLFSYLFLFVVSLLYMKGIDSQPPPGGRQPATLLDDCIPQLAKLHGTDLYNGHNCPRLCIKLHNGGHNK